MIIKRKLFSKTPKGNEETEKQKSDRRKGAASVAGVGTVTGLTTGLSVSDKKTKKIYKKGQNSINRINQNFEKDMKHAEEWTNKAMRVAKNPKEVLDYATKKINERGTKAVNDINRVSKVMNKSANKAVLKSAGKGAVIGTAVMAPLAIALNKRVKNQNKEVNSKRRKFK